MFFRPIGMCSGVGAAEVDNRVVRDDDQTRALCGSAYPIPPFSLTAVPFQGFSGHSFRALYSEEAFISHSGYEMPLFLRRTRAHQNHCSELLVASS